MAMTSALFVQLTDKLAARYLALLGTIGSGFGIGTGDPTLGNDWGYSKHTREYQSLVFASGDPAVVTSLLSSINSDVANASSIQNLGKNLLSTPLKALGVICGQAGLTGVNGIADFASYYNTSAGGPYAALVSPYFAAAFALYYSAAGALDPSNVYSSAVPNMGQMSVGGALAPGTAIDSTRFAGAAVANLTISGSTFTSPGAITVIGQVRTSVNAIATGRAFTTAAVNADGTYVLTPSIAGDLLISVTSITLPGTMTAGTAIVSAAIPAGRVDPPT